MSGWVPAGRPGYFGRMKHERISSYNDLYGTLGWRLRWRVQNDLGIPVSHSFEEACVRFYEESYYRWLVDRPKEVDFICTFAECIDNAASNVKSGLDYNKQESYSTHIQDIAVRRVLRRLNRQFEGTNNTILTIRSRSSNGHKFGPGNIPFFEPSLIYQPSLVPNWAKRFSVEDFWQSNKFLEVWK